MSHQEVTNETNKNITGDQEEAYAKGSSCRLTYGDLSGSYA